MWIRNYEDNTREWQARSNDPGTWLTLENAADVAMAIGAEDKTGIFLEIMDIIPGYRLGGIDYDTCFDENGHPAWWVAEALARLNTYTEISPTARVSKVFPLSDRG